MQFKCKYCGHYSTITPPNYDIDYHQIATDQSKHGNIAMVVEAVSCPNPECKELQLGTALFSYSKSRFDGSEWRFDDRKNIGRWHLLPKSRAKPFPDYIPQEIRRNHEEACSICSDSPKASAAMARRCLQGIIRDFWDIPPAKRGNLGSEINFIKDRIDPDTLDSIIAVREVGDIGAHMEKSVDTIVDVDPEEAELLIELIETLISDWYISRHRRTIRNNSLREVAQQKREAKKLSKDNFKQLENKTGNTG